MEVSTVITVLLVFLCSLATLDIWRQIALRGEAYWYNGYTDAVRSEEKFWSFGFHLEDLELKNFAQTAILENVVQTLNHLKPQFSLELQSLRGDRYNFAHSRESIVALHRLAHNDSSVVSIRCESNGPLIRIGVNDFRTDSRDACQLFSGVSTDVFGPQNMFEIVPQDEGAFALKSISSGYYISTVPPPQDNLAAPWKVVVGGPNVGAAERFRWTDEGYLYSSILEGYFRCGGGDMVKGFSGTYGSSRFVLESVPVETVKRARELVMLSNEIIRIQTDYHDQHQSTEKSQKAAVKMAVGKSSAAPAKICLAVPVTSKGTKMDSILDSPFWTNLFDSFMKSIDWRSNRYIFRFYLGFDKADELYDTGDAWSDLRAEFRSRALFRMAEQQMTEAAMEEVLKKQLTLKLMHFEHLQGAPTQIVSQLALTAYVDNFDYFYQVNDDTIITSPNWPPALIASLASNPSIPNFGVTGPVDTNNEKIFTHSFVHRTHIEVFGHLFPTSFKNWWSDDWISTVYGTEHTFLTPDVKIQHNVGAQKLKGTTRYEVDLGAKLILEDELRLGFVQVDKWLKQNSLPRLPLPIVCGYVPLTKYLFKELNVGVHHVNLAESELKK